MDGTLETSTCCVQGQISLGWEVPVYEAQSDEPAVDPTKSLPDDGPQADVQMLTQSLDGSELMRDVVDVELHTLNDLKYDYILGGQTLRALKAYEKYKEHFVERSSSEHDEYGRLCRILIRTKDKKKSKDPEGTFLFFEFANIVLTYCAASEASTHIRQAYLDQLENARQEEEDSRIQSLTGDERSRAEAAEQERRSQYDAGRIA